jgi:hypothetical protein
MRRWLRAGVDATHLLPRRDATPRPVVKLQLYDLLGLDKTDIFGHSCRHIWNLLTERGYGRGTQAEHNGIIELDLILSTGR